MVRHGIAVFLIAPLLCPSLAFAEDAKDGKDKGEWRQEFCTESYAESQAALAYLEAKLNLTEEQKPAWQRWRQTKLDASQRRRSACIERQEAKVEPHTALDREARIEKALSAQLQDLQVSRPILQALYEGLNAEQKLVFDRSYEERHHRDRGEDRHAAHE